MRLGNLPWAGRRRAGCVRPNERSARSKTLVVFFVRANPFQKKNVPAEFSNGAIVISDPRRPVAFANGFEMQGRVQCVFRPQPIIFPRQVFRRRRQSAIQLPKLRRASAWNNHDSSRMSPSGRVFPEAWAVSASRFSTENLPAAASRFI